MSEKNVGDMSEICRKEKKLKTNMLSFYGELLPTINVGDFVGNLVGDFKNGEKDLAVMKMTGIIRQEGSDKTGVWVILEQGNTNS